MALSLSRRVRTAWLAVLAAIASLCLTIPDALAGSDGVWTISDMSGRVNIVRSGAAPVALTAGDELRPGDMIETAADSRAILVRDGESMVVAPNSRMGLPASNDSNYATLILQKLGTVLFKVEKQHRQHFEVKTPYLAAVVKGTIFAVSVNSAGASVHVINGAVQVGDLSGKLALVRPGQTALVSSAPGATMSIQGESTTAPTQRSNAAPLQDADALDAATKTADAASNGAPPSASNAAPGGFVIKEAVGSVDIDVATATNGLVQAAQAPGMAGVASPAQSGGPASASSGVAAVAVSGGILGSNNAGAFGSAVGNPGGATAGGIPTAAPAAASQGGSLPATASLVAQITASPGSQNKKEKEPK